MVCWCLNSPWKHASGRSDPHEPSRLPCRMPTALLVALELCMARHQPHQSRACRTTGTGCGFPATFFAPWDALEKEPNCGANLGYPIDWKEDLPVPNEISKAWPVCNASNSMITCKLYADLWLGKNNPRTISNPGCNLETFQDTDVLSRALNAFIEVIVFHRFSFSFKLRETCDVPSNIGWHILHVP